MSLKDAFANSLLMFVAATCVVLIVRALPQTQQSHQAAASSADPSVDPMVSRVSGAPTFAIRDGVMVSYLHGNIRCPTCRAIESYAQQAVQTGFAAELQSGKIQWQAINYESPGNEHFATDYEVVAPNVVLAMYEDGKQVKWKGLPEVWEYVSDQAAFTTFVQTSLREFLGEPQVNPPMATNSIQGPAESPPASLLPIPE